MYIYIHIYIYVCVCVCVCECVNCLARPVSNYARVPHARIHPPPLQKKERQKNTLLSYKCQ